MPHGLDLKGSNEASKQREKHGGLCGFGVLSEILDHRDVGLLEKEEESLMLV